MATTLQIFHLSLILLNQFLNFSIKNSHALCIGPYSYFIYLKAPHYVSNTFKQEAVLWFHGQFLLYRLYLTVQQVFWPIICRSECHQQMIHDVVVMSTPTDICSFSESEASEWQVNQSRRQLNKWQPRLNAFRLCRTTVNVNLTTGFVYDQEPFANPALQPHEDEMSFQRQEENNRKVLLPGELIKIMVLMLNCAFKNTYTRTHNWSRDLSRWAWKPSTDGNV